MNNRNIAKTTTTVVEDIKSIIDRGRATAYAAVNTTMIATYWNIGRRIVEEEQHGKERAEYGTELIKCLQRSSLMSMEAASAKDIWPISESPI